MSGSIGGSVGGGGIVNPKGYGDGAIVGLCSAGVDSLGGGGAELEDRASLRATDVFPLPRLKLDRSPARDSVPTAGYGILQSAVRRPELARCQGSPARVVPGERDESGGSSAAYA